MLDDAAKVELIKRLSGDIHRRLSEGPAEALNGPSACSEWDVGTVAAHLAGGAVRQREALLRGLAGEGGPPEGESVMPTADQVQQANAVNNPQMRAEMGRCIAGQFPAVVPGTGRHSTGLDPTGQSVAGTVGAVRFRPAAIWICGFRNW